MGASRSRGCVSEPFFDAGVRREGLVGWVRDAGRWYAMQEQQRLEGNAVRREWEMGRVGVQAAAKVAMVPEV